MKLQGAIITAGSPRANEDRLGFQGTMAWVIDGVTDLYEDSVLPADRDVHWLVDRTDRRLREAGADGYRGGGVALLESIADEAGGWQTAYNFPADRVPPACSIALCINQGTGYELVRIGDATAVTTRAGTSTVMSTKFFDRREAAAVRAAGTDPEQIVAAMHQRRLHTMTAGDVESVFSGHPRRRLRPHVMTGSWRTTDRILLCTDGFARLVTDYGLYQRWVDVVDDAEKRGLAYLERLIRNAETDPRAGAGRFKRADDASALLLASSR